MADPEVAREELLQRLRLLADRLAEIEREIAGGAADRGGLDDFIAELRGLQIRLFGPQPKNRRGGGAKTRILSYLLKRVGQEVAGEELAEVSGIQEWARRVRELRVQDGYEISELGSSTYRLEAAIPDEQRAAIWKRANVIRRQQGSGMERIAALLDASVGEVVTREQIDYVGKISEGSRRVRELRDEHGWPIDSHVDDPTLGPGEYRLTSNDPKDRREPLQRLYPEGLRQKVFERDSYTCQACGRDRQKAEAAGDSRFYLEVHHKVAVADDLAEMPPAERNKIDNLITLCHRDHLEQTAQLQRRKRKSRTTRH
ncbi:MAG TPA: HNH endonuclease signature motif containing protein [Solirubrobacterales bacterium]|nr:HNH endonuclease signature motif containing protein [Solirubrobacterales bacterium]